VTGTNLTVLATPSNFSRARHLVVALKSALGNETEITLRLPESEIADLAAANWSSPGVRLFSQVAPVREIIDTVDTEIALIVPEIDAIEISGVALAIELMEKRPDVAELGGLIVDADQQVVSGAFRVINDNGGDAFGTAPLEMCEPIWERSGEFATTSADFLGGLLLVRRGDLSPQHLGSGCLVGRALSIGRPTNHAARQVFSGLKAFTADSGIDTFSRSGEWADLSPDAFESWSEAGLRQVTVLHRGVALRNDLRNRVTFHADSRIRAVDGWGGNSPGDPSVYYSQERNGIQLGPGFRLMMAVRSAHGTPRVSFDDFRGSVEGLTEAERIAISIIRRITGKLPSFAMTLAKKTLTRLSKKDK